MLRFLSNNLTMHLAFGRYVNDEIALDQRLATQAAIAGQRRPSFDILVLNIAGRGEMIRFRFDRVFCEFAFGAEYSRDSFGPGWGDSKKDMRIGEKAERGPGFGALLHLARQFATDPGPR